MTLESTIKNMQLGEKADYKIDEGTWRMPKNKKQIAPLLKLMRKPVKLGKDGEDAVKVVEPFIGDDELYDDLYAAGKKNPKGDARPAIRDALQRFGLPWEEEVEIDEEVDEIMEMNFDEIIEEILAEEDRIEEGKMKELHALIAKGMSAEDIAKKMKLDVKTIKSLMSSKDHKEEEGEDAKAKKDDPKKTGKEKVEINPKLTSEARRSAAQQARRDAGSTFKDKDDEEDDIATDADKKRGDLNIIMQLRKAADNPKHKVKFADGKAVAIKPGIVKTALQIFGKLKSNDKQKIQPQMAKSYKDMVKALQGLMKKAGYNENLEENWTMERMGISPNLVDAVRDIIMGKQPVQEKSGDAAAYKKFFDAALKKFKVSSASELEGEQKKKFYDYIDKNWESDAEKAGKDEEVKVEESKVEEEMTKAQEEKREEIVKELKKKTEEFKEKYGDRWETVMYATATKLAMKK